MPLLKKLYLIDRKGLFIKKFEKKFEIETIDYHFFYNRTRKYFFRHLSNGRFYLLPIFKISK